MIVSEEQTIKWKIELADAILSENPQIQVGDTIEHQTGTVWIEALSGDFALSLMETESE